MPKSCSEKHISFSFQDLSQQEETYDDACLSLSLDVPPRSCEQVLFFRALAAYSEKMAEFSCLPFHKSDEQRRSEEERNRDDEKRWQAFSERRRQEKRCKIRLLECERMEIRREEQAKEAFRVALHVLANRAQLVYHAVTH